MSFFRESIAKLKDKSMNIGVCNYILVAVLLAVSLLCGCSSGSSMVELDSAIEGRERAIEKREGEFASIKALLDNISPNTEQKYTILSKLIEKYSSYQFDSMTYYMNKRIEVARELGDNEKIQYSYVDLANRYGSAGYYAEALDILTTHFDTVGMTPALRDFYNYAMYKSYDQLAIYSPDDYLYNQYSTLRNLYDNRIENSSNLPGSLPIEYAMSSLINAKDYDKLTILADSLLRVNGEHQHCSAIVKFYLSIVAKIKGDQEQREKLLIESAIIDINLAIRDNTSLHELSHILLVDGDVNRAMKYNRIVLDDVNFYNARLRKWQDTGVASDIEQAYNDNVRRVSYLTYSIIAIILGFVLIAVVLIIKLMAQSKHLKIAKERLEVANEEINKSNIELTRVNAEIKRKSGLIAESNAVKEEYIANFMAICSEYIDRLINHRKQVAKYLSDDKIAELRKLYPLRGISNTSEIEQFYGLFDEIFTNLYPTFVAEVNELLREDAQIELRCGEKLNTELRILAMMRLGITDLSKIASLLRFSMSTIYNYRSKVRSSARCDKNNFETQIRSIGSIRLNEL